MPIELQGLLEDVQPYEGKNGFGANITMSTKVDKKTKRITFRTTDRAFADKCEILLDTDVIVKLPLEQSNFGLRLGEPVIIEQ